MLQRTGFFPNVTCYITSKWLYNLVRNIYCWGPDYVLCNILCSACAGTARQCSDWLQALRGTWRWPHDSDDITLTSQSLRHLSKLWNDHWHTSYCNVHCMMLKVPTQSRTRCLIHSNTPELRNPGQTIWHTELSKRSILGQSLRQTRAAGQAPPQQYSQPAVEGSQGSK